MKKYLASILIAISSAQSFAASDLGNRQITSFGIQGNETSAITYITTTPAPSTNCLYGVLYIYNSHKSEVKPMVATALAAYTADKPAKRLDYYVRNDGTCALTLINF